MFLKLRRFFPLCVGVSTAPNTMFFAPVPPLVSYLTVFTCSLIRHPAVSWQGHVQDFQPWTLYIFLYRSQLISRHRAACYPPHVRFRGYARENPSSGSSAARQQPSLTASIHNRSGLTWLSSSLSLSALSARANEIFSLYSHDICVSTPLASCVL